MFDYKGFEKLGILNIKLSSTCKVLENIKLLKNIV